MKQYENLYEKYSDDILTDNTQIPKYEQCKDCKHQNDGTVWSNAYYKGYCAKYPREKFPKGKPHGVFTGAEKCPQYEKE